MLSWQECWREEDADGDGALDSFRSVGPRDTRLWSFASDLESANNLGRTSVSSIRERHPAKTGWSWEVTE